MPELVPGPVHVQWCNSPNVDRTLTPNAGETMAEWQERVKSLFNNLIDTYPPQPC